MTFGATEGAPSVFAILVITFSTHSPAFIDLLRECAPYVSTAIIGMSSHPRSFYELLIYVNVHLLITMSFQTGHKTH